MKKLASLLLAIVGLLFVCAGALYATAWYHRSRAESLLAAIKTLHVGVSTQAEYEQAVRPIVGAASLIRQGDNNQPISGAYAIGSQPLWVWRMLGDMPRPMENTLTKWSVLEWTTFAVEPTFEQGRLTNLTIAEMQGAGHPFAGFVRVHAGVVSRPWPSQPEFSGYSAAPMGGNGRVIYTHVDMDDRATPEERRRALNFRFHCFTAFRRCSDGRQLLDPILTQPVP